MLVRADSHSPAVLRQVRDILAGRGIDYLFLDGDHTYDGVKRDFDSFSALAAPGALIAFHDIVSDKSPEPDHFVSVFWNETKTKCVHKEFIRDPDQSKLGLGLLVLPPA